MNRVRVFIVAILLVSCSGPRVEATPAPTGASNAAPRTSAPTPTEATIRKKVGTSVAYEDGWKLTVTKFEEQPVPTGPFRSTPAPGNRFVKLTVRYDNGTAKEASYNALDWKLQDSAGVRRTMGFILIDNPTALNSGKLAPGGFVSGSIIFELPSGEQQALAIYESFSYRQATWELY